MANNPAATNGDRRAEFLIPKIAEASALLKRACAEVGREVIGQDDNILLVAASILAGGHALIEGDPGVGKTFLATRLARVFNVASKRVQGTPDLMPSDIIGSETVKIGDKGETMMTFVPGPLHTNLFIVDEINRMGPRVQSGTLQAMQEKKITIAGVNYNLPLSFNVVATQNPHDHEGTYALPQAQLDRFMMKLVFDYPDEHHERSIAVKSTGPQSDIEEIYKAYDGKNFEKLDELVRTGEDSKLERILQDRQLLVFQSLAREIPVSTKVTDAVMTIVRGSRPRDAKASSYINDNVLWGGGQRAEQGFLSLVKAFALIRGDAMATNMADVKRLVRPVMEHRMGLKFGVNATFNEIERHLTRDL